MEKPFLEVFPGLNIADELKELLKLVVVEKVTMTKDRSSIRVYIRSPRLIHKKNIYALEEGIAKQLFPGRPITIKILEKYRLSAQYTPEKLYDVYRDSILMELKHYGMIEYNILRRADTKFVTDDKMVMTIEDNLIYRERSKEVGRVLEKIFTERCGLAAEVEFLYKESEKKDPMDQPVFMKPGGELVAGVQSEENYLEGAAESAPWDEGTSNGGFNGTFGDENGNADVQMAAQSAAGSGTSGGRFGADPGKGASGKNGSGTKTSAGFGAAKQKTDAAGKGGGNQIGKSAGGGQNGKGGGFTKKTFGEKGKGGFSGGFRKGSDGRIPYRKSENPDVLFGRDFEGDAVNIHDIDGEIGEVVIRGKVIRAEKRELRSGNKLMIFDLTDFTDSITVKMFLREGQEEDATAAIKEGNFIKIKGITTIDKFDGELTIGSIVGIRKSEDFTTKRVDNAPVKRVELHCHTKMSDMDGVSNVADIIKRAKKWGMPALAVTDHGCVQAFTEASHSLDKNDPFKVIYGVEGYLVDDTKQLVENSRNQSFDDPYVVFDIETTGFSPLSDRIIEIGAVKVVNGTITDKFSTFVNPDIPIPFRIEQLTSINDSMVLPAPKIDKVLPDFLKFCEGCALVAHNASFDVSFIAHNAEELGLPFDPTVLDTVTLARILLPQLNRYKLDTVAKALNVSLENHHRGVDDAGATAEILVAFLKMLKERDISTLDELNKLSELDEEGIKKLPTYHIIILAKNDVGRVNLYRLVSWAHINYFHRVPRIPKSVLAKYREGLIIGSACEAGELFQAVVRGVPDSELGRIVNFYDYLEIQPIGNNAFMIRNEDSSVQNEEDLRDLNRRIVRLGEQFQKPVCATCDVHFLDPEDEVYRRIIMAGKGFIFKNYRRNAGGVCLPGSG